MSEKEQELEELFERQNFEWDDDEDDGCDCEDCVRRREEFSELIINELRKKDEEVLGE